ncbi:MAG: FKBP-type peptidyl-prolyl cis-trans isomerase [Chthoniobacterales bacterium]|nr:FKBP-type peptidyl-prolyl cis-trans isomerase [Chthoniobacterales bacterium]
MNRPLILLTFSVILAASTLAQDKQTALKDQKDKVSYSIGLDIGGTFKKQNMDINADVLLAGLKDALSGAKPQLTDEQVKETMTVFSKEIMEKQTVTNKETGARNAAAGEKFLAENKTKDGIKVTPSGLQYKVLKDGTGPAPKETDTVEVNYRGTLTDGSEFDSSYKRGQPASFPVNRVIKGWTEGLQLMKVGSKYQFFIPANLAYGERGAGQDIGPSATLLFEVDLISVKPADGKPEVK